MNKMRKNNITGITCLLFGAVFSCSGIVFGSEAYTPSFSQQQTIDLIHGKMDQLLLDDEYRARELHFKLVQIQKKIENKQRIDPWKYFLVKNLIGYIELTFLNKPVDLQSDASITKFVSRGVHFDDIFYVPDDLIRIYPTQKLAFWSEFESEIYLSKKIVFDFDRLIHDRYQRFGKKFIITSAYRAYEQQRDWFTQDCRDSGYCAYPGHSEHQTGLAVDVGGLHGEYYQWMSNNAHLYGFHQSYKNGIEVDFYHRENRHWRYLGVELSTELYEKGVTFTERVATGTDNIDEK